MWGESADEPLSGLVRAGAKDPRVSVDRGVVCEDGDAGVSELAAEECAVEAAGEKGPDGPIRQGYCLLFGLHLDLKPGEKAEARLKVNYRKV
jgi:hypothetical protein